MPQTAKEKAIQIAMRKAESHRGLKKGDFVKVQSGSLRNRIFQIDSFSILKKKRDFIGATFAQGQGDFPERIHHEVGDVKKIPPNEVPHVVKKFIKIHQKENKK